MFNSFVVFPLIMFFCVLRFKKLDKNEGINLLLFPAIVSAGMTFAIMMLIAVILRPASPNSYKMIEQNITKIVPLSTQVAGNSTFFLESGKIGGAPYYFFSKETSNSGKILNKIPADKAVLYEDSQGEEAYVANLSEDTSWLFNFFVPKFTRTNSQKIKYAIHVPKGTIKYDTNSLQ